MNVVGILKIDLKKCQRKKHALQLSSFRMGTSARKGQPLNYKQTRKNIQLYVTCIYGTDKNFLKGMAKESFYNIEQLHKDYGLKTDACVV